MDTVTISAIYIMKNDYKTTRVVVQPKDGEGYAATLEVKTSALALWISKKQPTADFPYSASRLIIYTPVGGKSLELKTLRRGEALSLLDNTPKASEICHAVPRAHTRTYSPVPYTV